MPIDTVRTPAACSSLGMLKEMNDRTDSRISGHRHVVAPLAEGGLVDNEIALIPTRTKMTPTPLS